MTDKLTDDESYLNDTELTELFNLLEARGIDLDTVDVKPKKLNKNEGRTGLEVATLGPWSYKPGYLLILEQQGKCRLSDITRREEEQRLAAYLHKKKMLRNRKRYTRKVGRVHPKRKEATLRRNRERKWAREPLTCILYRDRRKCKRIDQRLWEEYITPLWNTYDPKDLVISFPKKAGTRADPWSMWNMTVTHRGSVVYDGQDIMLYELSKP